MAGKQQNDPDTLVNLDTCFLKSRTDATLEDRPDYFGKRRIGLAIVGLGRMGSIHLSNALKELRAKVLYIIDLDTAKLEYLRKKYFLDERGVKLLKVDDWKVALEDKEVEAVLISTTTHSHGYYAETALEYGKHVLCEKPLAKDTESVQKLIALADSKKLILICTLMRRYDPSFRVVARRALRGDVGSIRTIRVTARDSPTPSLEYIKSSGGIFHDCLIHDADVVLWIANELPTEVHSFAESFDKTYEAIGDYDTGIVTMKFPSGLMATVEMSRVSNVGYEQRVEVFGTKGVLKLDEVPHQSWEVHSNYGVLRPSQCYSFATRYSEAYANEITNLFNHIEGFEAMEPVRTRYLIPLSKVLHAAEESKKTGKTVKLEWTQEELNSLTS